MFKDENRHYSLRKLSVGLASVLIGLSFASTTGNRVKADTVSAQTSKNNKIDANADASKEVVKSINSVNANKLTPSQTVLNKQATSNDLLKGTSDQNSVTEPQKNLLDDLGKQKTSAENNQAEAKNQENRLVDQINYKLTNKTSTDNKEDLGQNKVASDETKQAPTTKFDAEKSIAGSSSVQQVNNQLNNRAEDTFQTQPQNSQKLDLTKNSPKFAKKALATNLTETNNKTTHSYTKEGSDPSVVKTPPKSLLASDNFDYSGTTTIQWNPKMTKGLPADVWTERRNSGEEFAYSNTDVDGVVATASITLTGNNYIIDPNTGNKTRIAKINRVFYDLKYTRNTTNKPRVIGIYYSDFTQQNVSIYGHANQLSEYMEYLDDQGNKINIPLAYDIQIIGSLDGGYDLKKGNENECVKGINGSIVYPYTNAEFINNDPNTNAVRGWDTTESGQALAIGGLTNGLTFYKNVNTDGSIWDQWTMNLATPSQMQSLPYSEIDTRGISRNIHFVDENGNQIQPTLTQTASWVSVKDKQGNIKTIGNQPNIAEYNIPHELTVNGKTYLIDAFTDGNSTKLASWTPANTDKNQDVYLVYKDLDVAVKYVDAVSGQTVKNDNFVSDPSQSVTYNYSVPDGYVLEAPAKTSTSYTFGDDKSDTPTITINVRKAIKRHYRVIENLPDGTQKVIVEYNLTLPQRKDGTYGIPDFLEDGRSANGSDQDYNAEYIVMNKYFGGIPVMSSSNNVRINPDVSKPTVDYSNILFDIDQVKNTTPTFTQERGATINFAYYKNISQFTWTVSTRGITTDQNPSQDFVINYQHNTQKVTDPSQLQTTGKRTITISMPKGHGDQMTIVQTVGYKRTGSLDLYTGKTTYTDWVFDADTSNVTVNGQVSTQYQAYILKDGVVNYAPIKLPHINGYKAKLIQDKANSAMFMVSFFALPHQNNQSTSSETQPSDNVQSSQKPAQAKQKQPEPIQTRPADDKQVAQILNHIAFELMHNDSSGTADNFEPTQNDSAPRETADVTQKVKPEPAKPAPIETQVPVGTHDSLSNYTLTTNNPILDTLVFNNIESNGLTWQIDNKNLNNNSINVPYHLTNAIYKLRLPRFSNYELRLVKRGTTQDSISFMYINKQTQLNYVFNLKIQDNKYYLTVGKIDRVNRKIIPIKTYNVISYQDLLDIFDKYFK